MQITSFGPGLNREVAEASAAAGMTSLQPAGCRTVNR
jgi:hypothetical protein